MSCTGDCYQGRQCVCTKRCETMQQPCPNQPQCEGECDSLRQHLDSHSQQIDMAPSWRDYIGLIDLLGAIALIIFAGWISSYFWGLK